MGFTLTAALTPRNLARAMTSQSSMTSQFQTFSNGFIFRLNGRSLAKFVKIVIITVLNMPRQPKSVVSKVNKTSDNCDSSQSPEKTPKRRQN